MEEKRYLFNLHLKPLIYILVVGFLLLCLALSFLSVDFFVQYSSFPIGLTKAILGILTLALVDDVIFKKIDTIQEIKNKNVGYALIYLANAIIIAACIGTA